MQHHSKYHCAFYVSFVVLFCEDANKSFSTIWIKLLVFGIRFLLPKFKTLLLNCIGLKPKLVLAREQMSGVVASPTVAVYRMKCLQANRRPDWHSLIWGLWLIGVTAAVKLMFLCGWEIRPLKKIFTRTVDVWKSLSSQYCSNGMGEFRPQPRD